MSNKSVSYSKSISSNKKKKGQSALDFNVILSLSNENYITKADIINKLGLLNTYPHVKKIILDIGEQNNSSSSIPDIGFKYVSDEIKDQFSKDIKFDLTQDLINKKLDLSKNYIFITDDITRLDNDKFKKMRDQRYITILCKKDKYIITEVLKFLQTLRLDPNDTLIDIDNVKDRKPNEKELELYESIRKSMGMEEDFRYLNQKGGSGKLKIRITGTKPPELKNKDVLFFYHNDSESIKLLSKLFNQHTIKETKETKKLKKKTRKRINNKTRKSIERINIQSNEAVSERVKNYNTTLSKINQNKRNKYAELHRKLDAMKDLINNLESANNNKSVNSIKNNIQTLHTEINELLPKQAINDTVKTELDNAIEKVEAPLPNVNELKHMSNKTKIILEEDIKNKENKNKVSKNIDNIIKNINNKTQTAVRKANTNIKEKEVALEQEKERTRLRKEQEKEEKKRKKREIIATKGTGNPFKNKFRTLKRNMKRNKELKKQEKDLKGKSPGFINKIKTKLTRKRKPKPQPNSPSTYGKGTDL